MLVALRTRTVDRPWHETLGIDVGVEACSPLPTSCSSLGASWRSARRSELPGKAASKFVGLTEFTQPSLILAGRAAPPAAVAGGMTAETCRSFGVIVAPRPTPARTQRGSDAYRVA